jgi:hypothetical protein
MSICLRLRKIQAESKMQSRSKETPENKHKAHTRYRLENGLIVPGVTTITGVGLGWNTQVLIRWANKMGLAGVDTAKYVDDKAAIGTLAHAMVTDSLQGIETDTDDYSSNQIKSAENSALSFFEWANGRDIIPFLIEQPLVSEVYKFGGTPDIYARIDGKFELIDLKTGSGIYDEMTVQVTAYSHLLIENECPVDRVRILNIPRTEDEAFIEKLISREQQVVAWKIFLNCLENYQLKKGIQANGSGRKNE